MDTGFRKRSCSNKELDPDPIQLNQGLGLPAPTAVLRATVARQRVARALAEGKADRERNQGLDHI
jgi:hypothetical protein